MYAYFQLTIIAYASGTDSWIMIEKLKYFAKKFPLGGAWEKSNVEKGLNAHCPGGSVMSK